MRAFAPLALLLLLAGCGGSPSGPSPIPPPPPPVVVPPPTSVSISGTITNTVTGAAVGTFTASAASLPARVTVSAPGYVTRETSVSTQTPTVDLIPEAGFDLAFYREFARGSNNDALRVLSTAPSIYLQTEGLSATNISALEAAARSTINELTGGRFNVVAWETGTASRAPSLGWMVIDMRNSAEPCGTASIGEPAGHIWLNRAPRCAFGGYTVYPGALAHEIGHALGFYHVTTAGSLMTSSGGYAPGTPSAAERYHAAIAYKRPRGNRDLDVD